MNDYLQDVAVRFHPLFKAVTSLTDLFCDLHLNNEYRDMCREMALAMCHDGTPMARGKPLSWAAGIVHAVGWVNFLQDPSFEPHMTSKQLARRLCVSQGTMSAKLKILREKLSLVQFDPDWCLPSLMADNSLLWMLSVVFLWAAREPMLQMLRGLGKSLEGGLKSITSWCTEPAAELTSRLRTIHRGRTMTVRGRFWQSQSTICI